MGRYDPLNEYLRSVSSHEIQLSFSDIEKVLGFKLPSSAYTYSAWWANGGHSQAYAWINAGYKVGWIDIFEKKVTFCKTNVLVTEELKRHKIRIDKQAKVKVPTFTPTFPNERNSMIVCGYEFRYIQDLLPQCNEVGKALKFYPQKDYCNNLNSRNA